MGVTRPRARENSGAAFIWAPEFGSTLAAPTFI
jgi:hypothetical protein